MCNVRCAARDQRPAANDRQRLAAYDPSGSAPMRGGIRRVGVVLPVVFRMTGCQNGRLLKKLPMRTISETRVRSRRSIQAPSVNQICRFAHLGYRSPPIAQIDPAPNRSQPAFFQTSGRFARTRQAPRRQREPQATRTPRNADPAHPFDQSLRRAQRAGFCIAPSHRTIRTMGVLPVRTSVRRRRRCTLWPVERRRAQRGAAG